MLRADFAVIVTVILIALALTGCSGGGGGSDEPPATTSALQFSTELDNFSGTQSEEWITNGNVGRLELRVRAFHRGNVRARIFDADGNAIYDKLYWHWDRFYAIGNDEYFNISFTNAGVPGRWTVVFDYDNFTGHAFVALEDSNAGDERAIPTPGLPGSILDPTFGVDGRAYYDVFRTYGVESMNDGAGRLVMVGTAVDNAGRRRLAAWRFTSDGGLDVNFGNNGISLFDDGNGSAGRGLAIDASGRVYVTGWVVAANGDLDFLLIRLSANGTFDASFGGANGVRYDDAGLDDVGCGVAVDSAGRILVAGDSRDFATNAGNVFCRRYFVSGAPDVTFAGGGVTTNDTSDRCSAFALDASDRPTIAGERNGDVAVWRFTTSGSTDSTFGVAGVAGGVPVLGEERRGLGLSIRAADGAIAVCGYRIVASDDPDVTVWRFDDEGLPEFAFSADGFATAEFPAGEATASAVEFDGSDRLVVAGVARSSGNPNLDDGSAAVWRFDADGDLDTGFGVAGVALIDRRSENNVITSAADLEPAGGGEFHTVGTTADLQTGAADLTIWRIQP